MSFPFWSHERGSTSLKSDNTDFSCSREMCFSVSWDSNMDDWMKWTSTNMATLTTVECNMNLNSFLEEKILVPLTGFSKSWLDQRDLCLSLWKQQFLFWSFITCDTVPDWPVSCRLHCRTSWWLTWAIVDAENRGSGWKGRLICRAKEMSSEHHCDGCDHAMRMLQMQPTAC